MLLEAFTPTIAKAPRKRNGTMHSKPCTRRLIIVVCLRNYELAIRLWMSLSSNGGNNQQDKFFLFLFFSMKCIAYCTETAILIHTKRTQNSETLS